MFTSDDILIYLRSNKERLVKEYHLTKIGIFGSMARNQQSEGSDIDLLVEFESNTQDLSQLKQQLRNEIESEFKLPVDICREKYIKPIFKKYILSEVIYA